MEAELKAVIEEVFTDYKKYHSILFLGFLFLIALIAFIQQIILQRNVAKFNSRLKKAEIKFSKYHNLQVEAMGKLFELITNIHYSNMNLFQAREQNKRHEKLKSNLASWGNNLLKLHYFFNRKEILFPETISKAIETELDDLNKTRHVLLDHRSSLEEFEERYGGDLNSMYIQFENEIDNISKQIDHLKKTKEVERSIERINTLRNQIESEFRKLVN